jgi:endonuclease/exonuclease/phosphatase family metal-dependent hydrolase
MTPAMELRAMTFNLRYAHADPPNLWEDRRPVVGELIRRYQPDLIATQEGEYHQLVDMQRDLPDYRWIGTGRGGGSRGEFMAVFYLRHRFHPLAFDHFWLSDTPDVIGSTTWGNRDPRMVTWVLFRDRAGAGEVRLLNTHLDHEVQYARECSAALILQRIAEFDDNVPLVVAGDFNAPAGENPVYDALAGNGPLRDPWRELGHPEPPLGTYHAFDGLAADGGRGRIDWILTRGPVEATQAEVITFACNGQYPSDHFPVLVTLRAGG